jgi:hypothetical protein
MTDPQRREVRVRRSPKIGVFLIAGVVLGALVALIAGNVAPTDPTTPKTQVIGYLLVVLAPVGALLGGVVALLLDRISERSARTVQAERVGQAAPAAARTPEAAEAPAPAAPAQEEPR